MCALSVNHTWAPVATESGRPGLPPCHTLMIASPVFVTSPMPEPIPNMAAMLQSESALKMSEMSQTESTFKMATISRSAPHVTARVSTQDSSQATPGATTCQSCFFTCHLISQSCHSTCLVRHARVSSRYESHTKVFSHHGQHSSVSSQNGCQTSFPVISSVVFGDNKAFSGHLRLASDLADPPLRSVRVAGIPRPSAVEIIEVVPLSAVLPVMAVAMLCVWAVYCILSPEPSPVQVSGLKPSPVQVSGLKPSPVQNPFQSKIQFKFRFLSQVQFKSLVLSKIQFKNPFRS